MKTRVSCWGPNISLYPIHLSFWQSEILTPKAPHTWRMRCRSASVRCSHLGELLKPLVSWQSALAAEPCALAASLALGTAIPLCSAAHLSPAAGISPLHSFAASDPPIFAKHWYFLSHALAAVPLPVSGSLLHRPCSLPEPCALAGDCHAACSESPADCTRPLQCFGPSEGRAERRQPADEPW